MLTLQWAQKVGGGWCRFHHVDLDTVIGESGVYIIWHAGNPSRVVYVGQGNVRDRIERHRKRDDICAYARLGELYVTWAAVPPFQLDGVERHLADAWRPLVGDAHPAAAPVAVNSPW